MFHVKMVCCSVCDIVYFFCAVLVFASLVNFKLHSHIELVLAEEYWLRLVIVVVYHLFCVLVITALTVWIITAILIILRVVRIIAVYDLSAAGADEVIVFVAVCTQV